MLVRSNETESSFALDLLPKHTICFSVLFSMESGTTLEDLVSLIQAFGPFQTIKILYSSITKNFVFSLRKTLY